MPSSRSRSRSRIGPSARTTSRPRAPCSEIAADEGRAARIASIQRWVEFWSRSDDNPCSTVLIILGTGLACTTPAVAQNLLPELSGLPACLRLRGELHPCRFTSIDQCHATASGRGATCYANPYFALRGGPARR